MDFKMVRLFALLFAVSFTSLSCTRDKDPSGYLVFNLPSHNQLQKVGAMSLTSDDVLAHIIVNVRGDGIPGIIPWTWDGDHHGPNGTTFEPAPNQLHIDVPPGPGRLIQYLGVYQNINTHAMTFYYGESRQGVVPGANEVSIIANHIGASSGIEHQVAGRLKSTNTNGPTGELAIMVRPPEATYPDSPAMHLMSTDIVGGWFSTMLIDNLTFEFVLLPQQIPLFELNPNVHLTANIDRLMNVHAPSHMRHSNPAPPYIVHFGYYGPGVSGNEKVCYRNDTSAPISGMKKLDNSTQINWSNSSNPGDLSVSVYRKGGVAHNDGTYGSACQDLNNPDTFLFEYDGLQNGIRDGLGIRGPFLTHFDPNAQQGIVLNHVNTDLTVSWKLLPGALASANPLTGITVFALPNTPGATDSMYGGDDIACHEFFSSQGFTPVADVPATQESVVLNNINNQNDVIVGLCPYTDSYGPRHFFQSFLIRADGGGGPNGGGGPVVTKVDIKLIDGVTTANTNTCFPVEVLGVDDQDNQGHFQAAETVNLSVTGAGTGTFYEGDDPYCQNTNITETNFNSGDYGWRILFFKPGTSGAATLVADASSQGLTDGSQAITINANSSATLSPSTGLKVTTMYGNDWHTHACEAVFFYYTSSAGNPAPASAGGNFYFDDNGAGGTFYNDPDCTQAYGGGPVAFSANDIGQIFFYKNTTAGNATPLTIRGGDNGYANVYGSTAFTIYNPGPPSQTETHVHTFGHYQHQTGLCYPIKVKLKDDNYNYSPTGAAKSYTIEIPTSTQAELFSNADCSTSLGNSTGGSIAASTTYDSSIYIMPKHTQVDITISAAGLPPENFSILPDRTKLKITSSTSGLTPYTCPAINFELQTSTNSSIPGSENQTNMSITATGSAASDTNFGLSPSAGCSGVEATNVGYTIPSGSTSSTLYFQTDSSSSPVNVDLQADAPADTAVNIQLPTAFTWP